MPDLLLPAAQAFRDRASANHKQWQQSDPVHKSQPQECLAGRQTGSVTDIAPEVRVNKITDMGVAGPGLVVTADFRMSTVLLNDGRVFNGIVRAKNDRTVTLQTAKDRVTIDRADIDVMEVSQLSLMPEGQLQPLSEAQISNLMAYLMTRSQAPLPPGAEPYNPNQAAPATPGQSGP